MLEDCGTLPCLNNSSLSPVWAGNALALLGVAPGAESRARGPYTRTNVAGDLKPKVIRIHKKKKIRNKNVTY
jgi:hypothetical protein